MCLYTIVPIEVIFNNEKKEYVKYKEINFEGEIVEVLQYENKLILNRLYTTNPKQYLNPRFQLGKVIKMWKNCKKIV